MFLAATLHQNHTRANLWLKDPLIYLPKILPAHKTPCCSLEASQPTIPQATYLKLHIQHMDLSSCAIIPFSLFTLQALH